MPSLNAIIKNKIQELGITITEAARLCGLSQRRLTHYANGTRQPSTYILKKISKCLDIPPCEFFQDGSDVQSLALSSICGGKLAQELKPPEISALKDFVDQYVRFRDAKDKRVNIFCRNCSFKKFLNSGMKHKTNNYLARRIS